MSAAAGLALVALVVAFALWEPRLRRAWLFLVPLALFLPDRSLANYLTDFVPAALVAAASVRPLHAATPGAGLGRPPTLGRPAWPSAVPALGVVGPARRGLHLGARSSDGRRGAGGGGGHRRRRAVVPGRST